MPWAYDGGIKIAAVVLIGLGVMLGIWQLYPRAAAENDKSAAFLQRHWRVPIPLQGPPPATYSAVEASPSERLWRLSSATISGLAT